MILTHFFMRNYIYIVFCFFSLTSLGQSTYYVSTSGDDNNVGNEASPFRTISKAINSFGATGGNCIIREGIYHESVVINNKDNITVKSYPNEVVVLDGTKEINTTWTQSSGNSNIYETTLTEDIWQLFIDNEQQVMARWPNAQFYDDTVFDQSYWSPGNANAGSNGVMVDDGNLATSGISAQGALAIANVGSFKTWTVEVLSHTPGNSSFTYETVDSYRSKHHFYFLEGKVDFLDTQNEWFYDSATKKLSVWGNPTGKKIQGKVQSYVFDIDKCDNLTFENLRFFSTTIKASKSTNITVNNSLFSYPSCSKRMLGDKSHPLNTEFQGLSRTSPSNFKLYQCLFEHTDGSAYYMRGEGNVVEDCYFHHIDYTGSSLRGPMVTFLNYGKDAVFTRNTVHTTGASETVRYLDPVEVSYNNISNTGLVHDDGAISQQGNNSVDGTVIHHNWFHDSVKHAIRFDGEENDPDRSGVNGIVHHNVIWNVRRGVMAKGNDHKIYNNTIFNCEQNEIAVINSEYSDPPGGYSNSITQVRNNAADKISGHRQIPYAIPSILSNNVYSNTSSDYGIKSLLNDPDNYDFTPKSTASELIDQGMVISGITETFDGNAPDIGAYELGDTWVPGVTWEPDFYPWEDAPTLSINKLNAFKFSYNNPIEDQIKLSAEKEIKNIRIYNIYGQEVLSKTINAKSVTINSINLSSGVYLMKLNIENVSVSSKILKR